MSEYTKSVLNQMNKDEVVAIAANEFGLEPGDANKPVVIEMILSAQGGSDGEVNSTPDQSPTDGDVKGALDQALNQDQTVTPETKKEDLNEKVKVIINSPSDGQPFLKIGHNGTMYQINFDEEVEVPRFLLKVIDDAVETHYEEQKNGEYIPKNKRRFSYTTVI